MLDLMRRNAGSWVIKGILAFIALTFIWWGVGSFSQESADTVATVGKERITAAELEQGYASLEKTYRDVYGAAFTREMAKALDLKTQALETLIQREILLAEAERLGLEASTTEVQRDISTNPAFQNNGAFSEERYRSVLQANRMSPSEYEGAKRTELTLRKVEGVIGAAARVTEAEARELFDLSRRRVRLVEAAFDPARAAAAEPTEAETTARYAEAKEKLRIPARVKISVARFAPETFGAAGPAPTEQELRAFHEGNGERFRTTEEREVTRAFFPASAATKEEALKKAGALASAAPAVKDDFLKEARKAGAAVASSTLSRKATEKEGAAAEVEKAVFGAGAGAVVGPLPVEGGVALYRVDRIRFPEAIPFEQVRAKVEQALRQERGRDQAVIAAYKAREAAEKGRSLAGALPPGVKAEETGWLADGAPSGDVPPAVVQEALVLPAGTVGPVKSLGDVHWLFQVAAKEDSRVPALAEVKERVVASLREEKRKAAARAAATKVLAAAKTAAELEKGARAAGAAVTTLPPFAAASGKLPPSLEGAAAVREEIARLTLRSPVLPRPLEAGKAILALALGSEELPSAEEWGTEREAFLKKARERKKEEILSSFVAERRAAAKVTVNQEALK